ncbi:MAG: ABC transporter permease [Armatimonadetes bacterium]|nr:ABC transporter permease [Armatimonadota bacterium]
MSVIEHLPEPHPDFHPDRLLPRLEESTRHSQRRGMSPLEACRVAFQGLTANKMRSFLTMLGIIIGVSAVIVMVSLGQGAAKATREAISRLGTNVLSVNPNAQQRGGVSQGLGSAQTMKIEDVDVIRQLPGVKAVSPEYRDRSQAKFQSQNTSTNVMGVSPEYFEIRNLPLAEGKIFDEDDVKRKAKVAVIGDEVRENLFGSIQATGKYIKLGGQNFKVVGVLKYRGGGWMSPDDRVMVPVSTAMVRVFGVNHLSGMSVQAVSQEKMRDLQFEIEQAMKRAHKLRPEDEADVRIFNQADISESADQQSGFLTMLLSGIALVSLLVGGIGIMNIMLVSVTERTREIGIRKAIGAKRKDILYQFLIESVTLSVVGGLIGIALGVGAALWMARPADQGGLGYPMLLTLPPIVISFCFSALVGIFFGIYPAFKASRLDPIVALRYE